MFCLYFLDDVVFRPCFGGGGGVVFKALILYVSSCRKWIFKEKDGSHFQSIVNSIGRGSKSLLEMLLPNLGWERK